MNLWPKKPTMWMEYQTLNISVPFTWNLPEVKAFLMQKSAFWNKANVGGPAVELMPDYLSGIPNVWAIPGMRSWGVLQRINPLATRTTLGCIRSCPFCAIGTKKVERNGFQELPSWPDLPIICDNNLLAASQQHFDKVMDRLEKHVGVDFNQGLDARLLTEHHASRFARLKSPSIRLSLDTMKYAELWDRAIETLLRGGVKRSWISSYALIGFDSHPTAAWQRCGWMSLALKRINPKWGRLPVYPMWFHELDCLEWNQITAKQHELGWTHKERTRIMRRFWKAKYGGYLTH